MHWISLYDCLLLCLFFFHLFKPAVSFVHPVVLLVCFVVKEILFAHPLAVTRLLVLFVSLLQVYVFLPLTKLWGKQNLIGRVPRPQISCMHNFMDVHHVATSGFVCDHCSTYRVRYPWQDKHFSILLPARTLISECVGKLGECSHRSMCPPLVVSKISYVWRTHTLDITDAVMEVLGPERDGHAGLSQGLSLTVHPLSFLVWMASLTETTDNLCLLPTTNNNDNEQLIYELRVEMRTGDIVTHMVAEDQFTVADLMTMCTKRRL